MYDDVVMYRIFSGRMLLVRITMLTAMLVLVAAGIAVIYASGNPAQSSAAGEYASAWKKQIVYAAAGIVSIIILNMINYRWLGPISYLLYAAVLAVLAVLLLGKYFDIPFVPVINNTCRWIRIGTSSRFVQLQPSEFCKIAYILALAWYLRFKSNYSKVSSLVAPFAITLLAMVLILKEPDLGTVLLMMPILFAMVFAAGAKSRHLLIILLLGILATPVLWNYMNFYQRQRISCVLLQNQWLRDKAADHPAVSKILTGKENFDSKQWQRGRGWQLAHSKLAIASGGLAGYGFAKGPYIKYNTLPERHNDFIFAIIAHQWGFIGCCGVLILYGIIIACANEIALGNTDPFARLVTVGITAMFAVQVIVNISMTLGLMPITGLTLPFISYGGSSLLVNMTAVGLLNNIGRSRPFTVAKKAFEGTS